MALPYGNQTAPIMIDFIERYEESNRITDINIYLKALPGSAFASKFTTNFPGYIIAHSDGTAEYISSVEHTPINV